MIRPEAVLRATRFLILLGAVVVVAMFLRTCEKYTIPAQDQSMDPTYPGGTTVYVKTVSEEDPLARGADVVYTMEHEGTTYARYGRVRGLPGDEVGERDGRLTVNGEPIGPAAIPGRAMGRVPEGTVLVLAINPTEMRYQDSRALGFIPRSRVVAVIRAQIW
jgi:signal peptidase I